MKYNIYILLVLGRTAVNLCRVVCAVTIPTSRLHRATSLYTKEAPFSTNILLNCHSEQKRCVWENKKRVRRICDEVASLIFLRWYVFYFPIEVSCCRKAAKILRLILCAPLKVLRLRMTTMEICSFLLSAILT